MLSDLLPLLTIIIRSSLISRSLTSPLNVLHLSVNVYNMYGPNTTSCGLQAGLVWAVGDTRDGHKGEREHMCNGGVDPSPMWLQNRRVSVC